MERNNIRALFSKGSMEFNNYAKERRRTGIRDLINWNKACVLKLIWLLFFRSGSVLVAYFKKAILHDKTINQNSKDSWVSNKHLKMRETLYNSIKLTVGNGKGCRHWIDNWSPNGKLKPYLGVD